MGFNPASPFTPEDIARGRLTNQQTQGQAIQNQQAQYGFDQMKAHNDIVSQSIRTDFGRDANGQILMGSNGQPLYPPGTLDELKYYNMATKAGLSLDKIRTPMADMEAQRTSSKNIAMNDRAIQQAGFDAGGKAGPQTMAEQGHELAPDGSVRPSPDQQLSSFLQNTYAPKPVEKDRFLNPRPGDTNLPAAFNADLGRSLGVPTPSKPAPVMDAGTIRGSGTEGDPLDLGQATLTGGAGAAQEAKLTDPGTYDQKPLGMPAYGVVGQFLNSDKGGWQSTGPEPAPIDMKMFDLKNMDTDTVAKIGGALRNSGRYKGDDQAGPDMQGAMNGFVDQQWKAYLADRPNQSQYMDKSGNVDQGAFGKADREWRAKGATFANTIYDEIGKMFTGQVDLQGKNLTQEGQKLGNRDKAAEWARSTDSKLGLDPSVINPTVLGTIRDRIGKWGTLSTVVAKGIPKDAVGTEAYNATVEKLGQLAEGIAPTQEGSRLVERITGQVGPWQSYLKEGKIGEGIKAYFVAKSMGDPNERKAALGETLANLRESIAQDVKSNVSRDGDKYYQRTLSVLQTPDEQAKAAVQKRAEALAGKKKPAPSGWTRGADGVLRRAK